MAPVISSCGRGNAKSELPMHGGSKQLGTGLINKIKKDLGLK